MSGVRCWSSIVARPEDRAALRMDPAATWLVSCALPAGHPGPHTSDGGRGGSGRRPWLFWADNARAPQSCQVVEACPIGSFDGAPCGLFAGHPGPHRYPATAATGAAPSATPPAAAPPVAAPPGGRPASTPAHEGVTMGEKKNHERKKGKHKQADVPAPAPVAPTGPAATADYRVGDQPTLVTRPAPTPPAPPVTLGPDSGRGSLIEIVSSDGSTRTVVAPVTTRPAPVGAVSSDRIVARPDLIAGYRAPAGPGESMTVRRVPTAEAPASAGPPPAAGPARSASHSHAAGPDSVPFTPGAYADAYPATAPSTPPPASAAPPVSAPPASVPPASAPTAAPIVEPPAAPQAAAEAPELVSRQVGEALREVAQALTKLADALDPR